MDENELELLLAQRREGPLPSLPPNFRQNVWRAIRLRAASEETPVGWLRWLLEPLLNPAVAVAALVLAAALGAGLGGAATYHRAKQAQIALDLQVFGNSSPALPTTLLSHTK